MANPALTTGLGTRPGDARSDWVRLRTLILLRWMAVLGQLSALTAAHWFYQIDLPLGLCYMAVGASALAYFADDPRELPMKSAMSSESRLMRESSVRGTPSARAMPPCSGSFPKRISTGGASISSPH